MPRLTTCLVTFLLALWLLLGTACRPATPGAPELAAPLPTLRPTAVLDPTAVPAAPTPTIAAPVPPAATAAPTPTPQPTVVPEIELAVGNFSAVSGRDLTLTGRVRLGLEHRMEVSVFSLDGRLLAAVPVTPGAFNSWQATVALPVDFAGQGTVRVVIFDGENAELARVDGGLVVTPDTDLDRYLEVYRPSIDTPAVAVGGYYLFFDGYALRPTGFRVAIDILDDGCRRRANRQGYGMRGSGYWQAFIVVPDDVEGETCALVSFGEGDTADRREVILKLDVLSLSNKEAARIVIGSPTPNSAIGAGKTLALRGIATNAPQNEVLLTLLLADGRIAATETAEVNRYGYWEASMLIPVELRGEALLRATIGPVARPLAQEEFLLVVEE